MPITLQFPMYQNPPIKKADISRYQAMYSPDGKIISHFNMKQYATKSRIITLRGGVAADGLDWELDYNSQAAVTEDVLIDELYHYTKLWKNLDTQASIIQDMVELVKSRAPMHYLGKVALDIEANDGLLKKDTFTGNAEKLVNKVYSRTSIIVDIYTRAYFWNANTYMASWMKECGLWDAHHFTGIDIDSVPIVRPYVPDAWAAINNPIEPLWWQVDTHDEGAEWGSTGDNEIDINFFTWKGGTVQAWEGYYGRAFPHVSEPPVEPPPAGELVPIKIVRTTASAGLNIRSQPNADPGSDDIGTLQLNSDVPVFSDENGFYLIKGYISKTYTRDL